MTLSSIRQITLLSFTFYVYDLVPNTTIDKGINLHLGCPSPKGGYNKYGDSLFCRFKIDSSFRYYRDKGVYCFMVGNAVKYIGKTIDSYGNRINAYGRITPGMCGKKGQPTDCRINSLINKTFDEGKIVRIGFCPIQDNDEIGLVENQLLALNFEWNIKLQ